MKSDDQRRNCYADEGCDSAETKRTRLTQEQVAERLGVSAPAVNKWESGASYPDITLLSALARLLETDLNELFCFRENLTKEEITGYANEIGEIARKDGVEKALELVRERIREYPPAENFYIRWASWVRGMSVRVYGAGRRTWKKISLCSGTL